MSHEETANGRAPRSPLGGHTAGMVREPAGDDPSTFNHRPLLRVLTVDDRDDMGGTERYLLGLARLLAERGVDQVLAARPGAAIAEAWCHLGLRYQPFPFSPSRGIREGRDGQRVTAALVAREFARSLDDGRALARLAGAVDAGAIHSNSHWTHLGSVMAGRLTHRPAVIHLHDESLPGIARQMRAVNVRLAAWTIAVSDAVALALPTWAGTRVTVIRHGVDIAVFRPGPPDDEIRRRMSGDSAAPLVLVAGRLDPVKGVDDVIRAVAGLPPDLRSARLAIAGPDPESEHGAMLQRLGAALLGDRVRFLGPVDEIARFLRAADVVALASRHEGLGLVVLEAQASGTPVVAYPTGGIPELIVDGRTGLLTGAADPMQLSDCLTRLLRDPGLRQQIGCAARRETLDTRTIDVEADRESALLQRLVRGRVEARG